ncbi:hypothetical protein AAF712_010166 [Marasmius tenuissimus]|uniref:Uncharacterized protein n=1 Tax=Marasmius tenuissimus TaxID=585030 RepID=A0ABR2ZNW1_9AGAR
MQYRRQKARLREDPPPRSAPPGSSRWTQRMVATPGPFDPYYMSKQEYIKTTDPDARTTRYELQGPETSAHRFNQMRNAFENNMDPFLHIYSQALTVVQVAVSPKKDHTVCVCQWEYNFFWQTADDDTCVITNRLLESSEVKALNYYLQPRSWWFGHNGQVPDPNADEFQPYHGDLNPHNDMDNEGGDHVSEEEKEFNDDDGDEDGEYEDQGEEMEAEGILETAT